MKTQKIKVIVKKRGEETLQLYVEVYYSRNKRKLINSGISILKYKWNKELRMINEETKEDFLHNQKLRSMVAELEREQTRFFLDNKVMKPSDIDVYKKRGNESEESQVETFNTFYKAELLNEPSTVKNHIQQLERTLFFLNKFNPVITFQDLVNPSFVRNFDAFLKKQDSIKSQNTVWKHHKNLKKFINLAIRYRKISRDNHPYDGFVVKKEESQRLDLDFEELNRVWNLEIDDERKNRMRLMFLFACYTGLRRSDIQNLEINHFSKTIDGLALDLDKIIKTKRPIKLPIGLLFEGRAVVILKQVLSEAEFNRLGYFNEEINRKIFKLNMDDVNVELKIIQRMCDIKKKLSMHVGRHTFGTNLAELTGDPYLIMELMGISKIETAMIYIHNSRERTNRKLRKIDYTPMKEGLEKLRRGMY